MIAYALGNVGLIVLTSRLAGPFVFVTALACVIVMSVMAYPTFTARPWLLIAIMAVALVLPMVLESFGVLESTWHIEAGALVEHPHALPLGGTKTVALVVVASLGILVTAGIDAARIYRANRDARMQLATQAWHLRQLLPAHGPSVSV
jgi:hypothetical protein